MNNKTVLLTALCTLMHFCATAMLAPRAMQLRNAVRSALTHKTAFNGMQQTAMQMRSMSSQPISLEELNKQDANGRTSLHRAVINGLYKKADMLLEYDIDVNIQDNEGKTSLHLAAEECDWDAVQLLLDHKVNPDIQDNEGKTALHLISLQHDQRVSTVVSIIGLLLRHHANAQIQDNAGKIPYDYASDDVIRVIEVRIIFSTR